MGVLNVTPDSFFDGGRWFETDAAVAHGLDLIAEGADVVDVGGESTRPGAEPVDEAEERRRVVPVIEALAPHVRVSVDTRKAGVAEAAIAAGASLVNDVAGIGGVAMHMRGEPATMQSEAHYDDVVTEVRDLLVDRARQARDGGVNEVWIDPGIGFAKTATHNLALLRHLDLLVEAGFPVMVGTSRKSFLGHLPVGAGPERPSERGAGPERPSERGTGSPERGVDSADAAGDRLEASLATAAWAMSKGAAMVRVHDVAATAQLARLAP